MNNGNHQSFLARHALALSHALLPGFFSGTLVVILSVSFASLIFSGPLSAYIVEGISLAITTAIIVGLVVSLFSRCKPVIAMMDEDTAPVLALMAAFVVAALPAATPSAEFFVTALAAIVATTLFTGVGLTLLGMLRFGAFIQFLPHSVMGGYFSAVGWLLVAGGMGMVVDAPLGDWKNLTGLLSIEGLMKWLPAVVLAVFLMTMKQRIPRNVLLPSTILLAIIGWYLLLWIGGGTASSAMAGGYLLGPFERGDANLLRLLAGLNVTQVNWLPVLSNLGSMATIFLISVMSLMLCVSGLGFMTRTEPDMNQELKTAGLANIASGLCGGMIGLPSYSLSALAKDMGADSGVWVGIVTILVCVLVFVFGLELVAFIPRFILAGILVYLGVALLKEWLLDGWQKFSNLEYLVIPIILAVSVTAGFLQGVFVGLVAAIVLFVVKYSRTRVIRYTATDGQLTSNVDRPTEAQDYLVENGDQLLVYGLQGYLFFGTAGQVYTRLRERLADQDRARLRFLVIDFAHVTGLDASASLSFQKMAQLADTNGFKLLIAGLAKNLYDRLHQGGFEQPPLDGLPANPDLDRSMEWCEDRLLEGLPAAAVTPGCFEQLEQYLSDAEIATLKGYLEMREVESGQLLAEQGDDSDELYFMETCGASAYLRNAKGEFYRVRRSIRGTVYGELGFYLGIPRTATVMTDEAGVVYVLDQAALLAMEKHDPEVAAGLHRYMARLLSERAMLTTRTLQAFLL